MEVSDEELIDVSLAKDGGVKKKILKEAPDGADGPPPSGYEVTAHYTGKSTCFVWFFLHCVLFNLHYSSISFPQEHWQVTEPSSTAA